MKHSIWQQHTITNRLQSILLLGAMAGFSALLGWVLWGKDGLYILIIICIALYLLTPGISPQLIIKLYRGQQLNPEQIPDLYQSLVVLSQRSKLKTIPKIYYIPSSMINAFAVGQADNASIAVTDGLLRSLNLRETVNVIAHEISHIGNNDMKVMAIADMFSRVTSSLSFAGQILLFINLPLILLGAVSFNWLVILLLVFAPIVSTLAQLGLSRIREYDADLNAVRLTGDPDGLSNALIKIDNIQGNWIERILLPGRGLPEPSLLRTHPPTAERVRRLQDLKNSEAINDLLSEPHSSGFSHKLSNQHVKRKPRWHIGGIWH